MVIIRSSARIVVLISLLATGCHSMTTERPINDRSTLPGGQAPNYIDETKTIFPLGRYSQNVDDWIAPHAAKSDIPVIDTATQERYFIKLKSHYFGMSENDRSPWNQHYVISLMNGGSSARNILNNSIRKFLSGDSISYGENFRMHTSRWKAVLRDNIAATIPDVYHSDNRAITVRETLVRALPTTDPAFNYPGQAGEGYPFDNLQVSAIRPGTPLYVFATSNDKSWKYVVSPTVFGWIKSDDIASVTQQFVTDWITLGEKNLGAVIKEPVSFHDGDRFLFIARPGTILPYRSQQSDSYLVATPRKNSDGNAQIRWIKVANDAFTAMPWKMTPNNIAYLIKSMQGRPYGWGNYNFNNDCSAEVRSLLMPFGIFLPRNSLTQIQEVKGVDLSALDVNARINYLKDHGKPFTTLVYISGHIMLYIGNAILDGKEVPMTYQNLWGLRPKSHDSRSIIGAAVFFPVLSQYPEDKDLHSLADKKQFRLGFIE